MDLPSPKDEQPSERNGIDLTIEESSEEEIYRGRTEAFSGFGNDF